MEVDFDNLRRQLGREYNILVRFLNEEHRREPNGELRVEAYELNYLRGLIHDLKMTVVCLTFLSGENETFGEVGDDDTKFLDLEIGDEDED